MTAAAEGVRSIPLADLGDDVVAFSLADAAVRRWLADRLRAVAQANDAYSGVAGEVDQLEGVRDRETAEAAAHTATHVAELAASDPDQQMLKSFGEKAAQTAGAAAAGRHKETARAAATCLWLYRGGVDGRSGEVVSEAKRILEA